MTTLDKTTASSRVVRLVQVTDCHLGPDRQYALAGIHTYNSFKAVLSALAKEKDVMDLVMVTGDIAAHGSTEAYHAFLGEMADMPFLWLPGNHDDFDLMNLLNEGAFSGCHEIGNWRLISLNTAVPNRVGGRVSPEQLAWLDDTLARNSASSVAIFMHHPPTDVGCRWLDRQQVANGNELAEVLQLHKQVKAVFTGHVHQQTSLTFAGIPLYSTPSTCFQFAPSRDDFGLDTLPPGYRWIDLGEDGSIKTGVVFVDDYPEAVDVGVQGY